MGLLDRLKPAPLLRSGPLLLLPSGSSSEAVDTLVESWAPLRRRKGDAWQLADGLRWVGPIDVTMSDVTEHDLPGGYPIAYVAEARRNRGEGLADRLTDRLVERSVRRQVNEMIDAMVEAGASREELAELPAEDAERTAREYPHGEPRGPELDAWHLVCGLARRLGGRCRLADGEFFLPELEDVGVFTLYARTILEAEEVAEIVAPALGPLTLDTTGDDAYPADPDDDGWVLASPDPSSGEEFGVSAMVWPARVLDERMGIEPLAVFDRVGGLTVEYSLDGPVGSDERLLQACALLAPHVEGIVIDEEGFPVDLP